MLSRDFYKPPRQTVAAVSFVGYADSKWPEVSRIVETEAYLAKTVPVIR